MPDLPPRPDLGQLRRQATDLLGAARAGDADAAARMAGVPGALTLTSARVSLAREYGFPSWARLKAEAEARTRDLAEQASAFCDASIRDWTGRAARMLAEAPEIAGHGLAAAVVLGDAARVRAEIERDPGGRDPSRRPAVPPDRGGVVRGSQDGKELPARGVVFSPLSGHSAVAGVRRRSLRCRAGARRAGPAPASTLGSGAPGSLVGNALAIPGPGGAPS